jgi:hypothetical protein
MTSCGKLLWESCCVVVSASSSSPLDITAWLADSSISESSSDSFSDCREIALGVLGIPEVGNGEGASTLSGVRGVVLAWLESFLFSLHVGDNLELSGRFPELADELCDPDRDTTLSWCLGLGLGLLSVRLHTVVLSGPNAASRVSVRLCTPNELSPCLPRGCVPKAEPRDCSISSSLLMKKVVGTLDATAA